MHEAIDRTGLPPRCDHSCLQRGGNPEHLPGRPDGDKRCSDVIVTVTARAATTADLPDVAQLLADGSAAVSDERGGHVFVNREALEPPYEDRLSALLGDATAAIAIGAVDDVAMGCALARVETLRDGTVLARLEHLWVEPGAREVGLGGELIDLVMKWACEVGATRLDAYALPGNREAKNFLETAGFSARLIVMHRTIGAPSS